MRGEATVSYLVSSMTPLIALYIVGRVVVGLYTLVGCGLLPGMLRYMRMSITVQTVILDVLALFILNTHPYSSAAICPGVRRYLLRYRLTTRRHCEHSDYLF